MEDFDLDRIDQYLMNEMSPEERSAFEEEMAMRPELQEKTRQIKVLSEGIHYVVEKNARQIVELARDKYIKAERFRKWIKRIAVVFFLLSGYGYAHFFIFNRSTKQEQLKQKPIDKSIQKEKNPEHRQEEKKPKDSVPIVAHKLKRHRIDTFREPKSDPVAEPQGEGILKNITVKKIFVSEGKKIKEETLPSIVLEISFDPSLECVYWGNKIRLFVPESFANAQMEIIVVQGSNFKEIAYLKTGETTFYILKNSEGGIFPLIPIDATEIVNLLK